jgi:hypothetical protein
VIDTEASPPGTCNPTKETALSWNEQGVAGAPGAPGDTGPAGWVGSTYVVTGASGSFSLAFCDEGDFATGGGGLGTNYLLEVAPLTDNTESATGETPNGYAARVLAGGFDQVQVWVICVDVTP